ncbi:MAG: hypothetical protein J6X30_04825, partial [Clostridia bacterium]|nr:hypothetical protein [Clostridia bacterium]
MKELADFIRQGERFAVLSHISPDGDTMGSAAALIFALRKSGKQAQWFCEGEVPEGYRKIPEIAMLTSCEKLKKIDSVICVDVSSEDRLGNCTELFRRVPRRAVIDHYKTNTGFADVNVIRDRNAAGFAVMELLDELQVPL